MALSKVKTISIVEFENSDKGITYKYDATHDENSSPSRINFTVEKNSLVIARGYQDNLNGMFALEVIRLVDGFDRSASQAVIDANLLEIMNLLK